MIVMVMVVSEVVVMKMVMMFLRSTDRLREDCDIAVAMIAPPQVGS